MRPRFLTEAALGGELYATYNSKGFYGKADHTKFYVMGIVVATEHLHKRRIVHKDLQPENVLLSAKDHPKNNFDYQKPIHKDNVKDNMEKDFGFESLVENLSNYRKMVTDVITVAGNIDHETVKDFGFESFIEDWNNYMKMVTGVITVTGNIDSETVNDFGFKSLVEDQSNYMRLVTGAIKAAGNIDHETFKDLDFVPFVDDQSNYMKLATVLRGER